MSRHYVLGSWANADEYDYSYNGEQLMGSRHGKSVCMDHMLSNGKANLKRYADIPVDAPKKPKAKRSAFESICLADSHYNRLERQMEALQQQFDDGELSWDDFMYAHKLQSERMEKAWRRVCKARNWSDSEPLAQHEDPIEQINCTRYNESPILNTWQDELFHSLSDGNIFKIAYIKIKRIAEAFR